MLSIPFSAFSVQYLNVSGLAAVQVAQVGVKASAKTVHTVQNPAMLYIGKKGLTVKGKDSANTVKVGHSHTIVRLIRHGGTVNEFVLHFSA